MVQEQAYPGVKAYDVPERDIEFCVRGLTLDVGNWGC